MLPVTSNQDFFGISIVEAVYCNNYPILPNRLSYPEIFNIDDNSDNFYKNDEQLYQKLKKYLLNHTKKTEISKLTQKYDWKKMASLYDEFFNDFNS